MESMFRLYFKTIVGQEHKQAPFEAPGDVIFRDLVVEVAQKFGIPNEQVAIANEMDETLTSTDLQLTIKEIVKLYGTGFEVINRGVVG